MPKPASRRKQFVGVTPEDEARIERALDTAGYRPVVTLRVVTGGRAEQTISCDDSPTCECGPCTAERWARVRRGPAATPRQPWEQAA